VVSGSCQFNVIIINGFSSLNCCHHTIINGMHVLMARATPENEDTPLWRKKFAFLHHQYALEPPHISHMAQI
jgi:hypothetical protein